MAVDVSRRDSQGPAQCTYVTSALALRERYIGAFVAFREIKLYWPFEENVVVLNLAVQLAAQHFARWKKLFLVTFAWDIVRHRRIQAAVCKVSCDLTMSVRGIGKDIYEKQRGEIPVQFKTFTTSRNFCVSFCVHTQTMQILP